MHSSCEEFQNEFFAVDSLHVLLLLNVEETSFALNTLGTLKSQLPFLVSNDAWLPSFLQHETSDRSDAVIHSALVDLRG